MFGQFLDVYCISVFISEKKGIADRPEFSLLQGANSQQCHGASGLVEGFLYEGIAFAAHGKMPMNEADLIGVLKKEFSESKVRFFAGEALVIRKFSDCQKGKFSPDPWMAFFSQTVME